MYAFMWQCNTSQNITCDINWTGAGNLIIWTNDFPFKVNVLGISYFQSSVQIQSSPTNQIFYIIHGFISTYTNMCSKILCCIWRIVKINIDILYMYQVCINHIMSDSMSGVRDKKQQKLRYLCACPQLIGPTKLCIFCCHLACCVWPLPTQDASSPYLFSWDTWNHVKLWGDVKHLSNWPAPKSEVFSCV